MEQTATYNAWNHAFGARWNDNGQIQNELPNATIVVQQVSYFLCPSDNNKGGTYPNQIHTILGYQSIAAASNYPANLGMNRRANPITWQMNGPAYILSTWDFIANRQVSINSFSDGTSTTAIFSEWVKGSGEGVAKPGLGEIYSFDSGNTINTGSFPTDIQYAQQCNLGQGTPQQHWKGEWWVWGPTQAYSHTIPPNRTCCEYSDTDPDGRTTITARNASSMHPGGLNVLFMDGSVRFIKTSVGIQPWYALATPDSNEALTADSF
jgi:prepilin-type processing-associated H-X9-DG protein